MLINSSNHVVKRTLGSNAFNSTAFAPLASPALTGNPTAPTQASSENNTKIATTAYVKSQGYVTSNTQLSNETVQDIVGGMLTGNTESGITVTYDDTNNEIDFTVASQTDQNFTTTLKNKLDGIASNATANSGTVTGLTAGTLIDIDGGGTATPTVNVDLSELTDMTASVNTSQDELVLLDNGAQRRKLFSEIFGSNAFNSTTIPTNNNQLTNGASYITGNQTITLSGDVSGSGTTSISVTVADDSHNHVISNVDGLQSALDGKATAGDENIIDGATSIWNADGDGDVFTYNDSNPTHNSKGTGAVIYIRGDGTNDHSLVRAGIFTSDHVSTANGYYVGTLLGTSNSTTTQVINGSGEWTGSVIPAAKLSTATTQSSSENSTKIATTAYVKSQGYLTSFTETNTFLGDGGSLTTHPGTNRLIYTGQINGGTSGLFSTSDNSNSVLTLNRHSGNYNSQLGFSSNGNIYYRKFSNSTNNSQAWNTVWHSGSDGSGSGLDADKLDAQEGSYYLNYNNFTNTPTIPSLSGYATESYVGTQISNLVNGAPAALDTLNELAAAIDDNASYASSITTALAAKAPLASPALTGAVTVTGSGSTGNAFEVKRGSDGAQVLRVQNGGEVVVSNKYLYAAASGTSLYVQNSAVFRGAISNDTSGAPVNIGDDLSVSGSLTISGTVDGRDVASDGSKLDGIASNANNYSLPLASSSTRGGVKIGFTESGKNYPVELDSSEKMFVNVPWTDTNTQLSHEDVQDIVGNMVSGNTESGITVTYDDANNEFDFTVASQTDQNFTTTLKNKLDGIATNANNYSLPAGSSSTRGGFKIGFSESGKNYPVEVSSEKMFVNVPWTDTNTNTTYSAGTGITLSGTTFSLTDTASKLSLSGGTLTGTLTARDVKIGSGYHLQRSNHHSGHLEGSYNNVGDNAAKSNPIYTIGSSYNPSDAALGSMYGVGFTHTNASFISFTGASGWGQYIASDGDARIFLCGSNGVISSTGEHYVGSNRVHHNGYHPNADTLTTARTIAGTSFNGSANIDISYNNLTNKPTIPTNNNQLSNGAGYVTSSGNTIIGTDSDINTSGATVVDQLNMTDGVITSHSTRTLTLANLGYTGATNANNYSLPAGSSSTRGGFKIGFSESGKNYPVEVSSEKMYVNVPWTDTNTDTNTTYSAGTGLSLSGTTFSITDTISSSASNNTIVKRHSSGYIFANYFNTTPNTVSSGITQICVETGNDGYIRHGTAAAVRSFINVANGANNYSLPAGSSSTRGGFKIGFSESGKYYPVETSSEKMFVHVPWTDTNTDTNTTYSAGRGLDLSGTQFLLETDLRDSISHIGYDSNDYVQWSNNSYFRSVVNGSERFRVNTSGIDVTGSATANFFRTDTGNTDYSSLTRNSANNAVLYVQSANTNTNQPIAYFSYGSTTAAAGNKVLVVRKDNTYFTNTKVGVGTTSPSTALHVNGTVTHTIYNATSLPSASPAGQRAFAYSFYPLATSHGSVVSTNGSYVIPVYSDGSSWRAG